MKRKREKKEMNEGKQEVTSPDSSTGPAVGMFRVLGGHMGLVGLPHPGGGSFLLKAKEMETDRK